MEMAGTSRATPSNGYSTGRDNRKGEMQTQEEERCLDLPGDDILTEYSTYSVLRIGSTGMLGG
jgi:hypothetical protein